MIVDFHSHTSQSDGTLAPRELVAFMRERGVEVFSISDHDTLAAYDQFEAPSNARVVVGIEINTTYLGNEVHVLGYRLPLHDAGLEALLEYNRSARRERIERIVRQLQRHGLKISMDDVFAEADGDVVGRPHVGKALIRNGISGDIEEAFRNYLWRGRPGYVAATHIKPHEAIDAIHAAGGVAVLAHPGRLKDYAIIDELAGSGLDGLEVFYPRHDDDDVTYFREKSHQYGLVMTAGSDFHDIRYHTHGVGRAVDDTDIAPFLEMVLPAVERAADTVPQPACQLQEEESRGGL